MKINSRKVLKYIEEHSYITIIMMSLLGLVVYVFMGEWIHMEDDSSSYIKGFIREGLMPIYPFFLWLVRMILGTELYLNVVVIIQGLIAVFSTMYFVLTIQKYIKFSNIERVVIYVCCMLPFAVDLPKVSPTHYILTEGISYSLFYFFISFFVQSVWTLKFKKLLGTYAWAIVLALTRSQMIFLLVVCGVLFVYLCFKRVNNKILYKIFSAIVGVLIAAFMLLVSYKMVYGVVGMCQKVQLQQEEKIENNKDAKNGKIVSQTRQADSQVTAIIVARGFFEADEEDFELFEDEMMQFVFKKAYYLAKENGNLHSEVEEGLYMWRGLVYDRMRSYITSGIELYDKEFPGQREMSTDAIARQMGMKILLHHFDRYIYHTIRLMIPSFISAVFFQIDAIYLMCHFITLFIYLLAIIGCVIGKKMDKNRYVIEGMASTVFFIVMMVGIINAVFVGQQRYMIYAMGVFYVFIYLLLKEILYSKLRKNIG